MPLQNSRIHVFRNGANPRCRRIKRKGRRERQPFEIDPELRLEAKPESKLAPGRAGDDRRTRRDKTLRMFERGR